MAFRNLLEADCGGQNPLMKLGGHFSQDQAFRQERGQTLPGSFSDADCMVNDFLESKFSQNVQTFRMDALVEEMRDIESFSSRIPINQAPNVAELASCGPTTIWTEEFLRAEKLGAANDSENLVEIVPGPSNVEFLDRSFDRAVTNPRGNIAMGDAWSSEVESSRAVPESWMANFLIGRPNVVDVMAVTPIGPVTDNESKFEKFFRRDEDSEQRVDDELLAETTDHSLFKESDPDGLDDAWDVESKEFWEKMQKMWQQISSSETADAESWQSEFSTFVDPFKNYEFESENPMKELKDPFEEGLKKLEDQDLPSAVLCFEAAVQADPDNAKYWQYLGTTQAANEQDPFAIAALKKCLSIQPDNLTAILSLAISYTNENYQNQACQMLREWLQNNPKYMDLCSPAPALNKVSSIIDSDYHTEVKDLYIKAANRTPNGEIDVDVQCGLGVLFNLTSEYDKAVDCFKAALQASPKDFRMWNRLGATLANGNRSEEAVDAYYHALQLSPGFIRARYNLGITCINLKAYREAVEHLLTALNLQAKGTTSRGETGSMSDSIWGTLRLVVSLMGNHDALPHVEARNLSALNREYSIK